MGLYRCEKCGNLEEVLVEVLDADTLERLWVCYDCAEGLKGLKDPDCMID